MNTETLPQLSTGQSVVAGLRAGISLPPFMVFSAMLGFGSLAKSQDISLLLALLSAGGIYGMPGQVAMLEIYATGGTLLAILTGVAMANMRFLPMTIAMMPLYHSKEPLYRWRYLFVHLMSINSWTYMLQTPECAHPLNRFGFFVGFGTMCICGGLVGTTLGWYAAGSLSAEITLTLIFLNPAYFIFLFCTNRKPNILFSIAIGAVLGPVFYLWSPDWGLPFCGLVAGSIGFWICRRPSEQRQVPPDQP
ncbi:MAG: AzlC family ABC transporter permease [Gammaproteobacteria bacterium]|nr:AzlC family ABC transporter permease [Gammaproteobacteria bacterium]